MALWGGTRQGGYSTPCRGQMHNVQAEGRGGVGRVGGCIGFCREGARITGVVLRRTGNQRAELSGVVLLGPAL